MKKILFISSLALSINANAQVCFNPYVKHADADGPYSITNADFNGDGKTDLAAANYGSNTVSIFLGDGVGSFGTATNFTVGSSPYSVCSSDFNGDGKADLAVTNQIDNNVSILIGNGAGGFGAATNFAVGTTPELLISADFNGDGFKDLAVANNSSNNISILLGTGTGSFSAATNFAVPANTYFPHSVISADFNGDGKADLAVSSEGTNYVTVFLGTGTGSFGAATNFAISRHTISVVSADFNGDGKADLAVGNYNSTSRGISILLGDGAGGFGTATDIPFATDKDPYAVISADFNGDSKADLAVGNSVGNSVDVLLGDGTGGFATPVNIITGSSSGVQSITSADFNGDGKADLATAGGTNVVILLNCAASGIADLSDAQTISVYPNPASSSLQVTFSGNIQNTTIEVYNTIGECVHRQIATSANCQIDVSNLAEGVYNISISSNEGVVNKRVVIVR